MVNGFFLATTPPIYEQSIKTFQPLQSLPAMESEREGW